MNLSSQGTLYKQEFGDSSGSPAEGCPEGMAAGASGGWNLRVNVSRAWDVPQGKLFRGWIWRAVCRILKCRGRGADRVLVWLVVGAGRARLGAAKGHPHQGCSLCSAPCALLCPSWLPGKLGKRLQWPGLEPEASPSVGIAHQEDAGADLRHSTACKTTCYKRAFYRKEKNTHWRAEECFPAFSLAWLFF